MLSTLTQWIAEVHTMNGASNVLRANDIWSTDILFDAVLTCTMFPKDVITVTNDYTLAMQNFLLFRKNNTYVLCSLFRFDYLY